MSHGPPALPPISPTQISALIATAYDSALARPQWQSFLDEFCGLFPGIGAAIVGFEGHLSTSVLVESGFDPEYIALYRADPVRWNDSVVHMIGKPEGEVYGDSIVPADQYAAMDLVQNWLKPQGFGPSSMSVLAARDGRFLAINVAYPIEGGEQMRPAVEETMRCVVPHVIRALDISRILSVGQSVAESLRGLIQSIKLPMLITGPDGTYRFGNRAAESLLEMGALLQVGANGLLTTADPTAARQLRETIGTTSRGETAGSMILDGPDGAMAICMLPLGGAQDGMSDFEALLYGGGRNVAVLLGQRRSGRLEASLACQAFGLSLTEAAVCGLILDGMSPGEIAEARGTSVRTVRNQLQSVYDKTGVTSQRELADALGVFCLFGDTIRPDFQISGPR